MGKQRITLNSVFPFILMVGGLIGLFASFILTYDTLRITSNPHFVPNCNLNPLLNCGTVIHAAGDTIFGLPFPFYGIAAFSILITVGAGILASAKYKKWFWQTFQVAITLGIIGSYALLWKSLYVIHAMCPYCLSVDVAMTTIFWYVTLYNIDNKHITLPKGRAQSVYAWVRKHHLDLLVLWFLIVIAFILHHFWYYYGKQL